MNKIKKITNYIRPLKQEKKMRFISILLFVLLAVNPAFSNEKIKYNPKACHKPLKKFDSGHIIGQDQIEKGYNSPARIDVSHSWDIYLQGSFIYWQARERGLRYARTLNINANVQSKLHNVSFEFDPGFKVGLGLNFEHDDWFTVAEYARIHGTTRHSISTNETTAVSRLLNAWRTDSPNASKIAIEWDLDLDLIDWKLGRPFYEGTNLIFNPFVGLRGGWIDQKITTNTTLINTTTIVTDKAKQDTWLVGPRAGVDSYWLMPMGFSFFGNIASAFCYQYFNTQYLEATYANPSVTQTNTNNKKGYITPNLDISVGFRWGSYFHNDSWHFRIVFGYSLQAFWNQNEMRRLKDRTEAVRNAPAGDLFYHGAEGTLRFDF